MAEREDKERRRFERLGRRDEIKIKEYSFPERGAYKEARIIDISGGGLQIEAKQRFAEKAVLKIEMNFTGWQRYTSGFLKHFGSAASRPLVVLAEVVRCKALVPGRKYEIALSFSGIDESHRNALVRFIRAEILSKD
jgi:hypothetical protein